MADNVNKEKIIIDVQTNADKASKSVDNLSASIEQTTEATKELQKANKGLDATFEEVYGDLQPLTTRMGEAEDRLYELALAGKQATQEYRDLLGVVSQYRQTQIETDRVVDAASVNLGGKFAGATQIAATGIQGVTSGMALFGEQSEDTEQALLKVQAAMAFADSVKSISELGGQFQVLKNSIQQSAIAQRVLNLVARANPYVLIATAIAAASAAIYGWIKVSGDAAEQERKAQTASEQLTLSIEHQSKAFENNSNFLSKSNDQKINLLRASGASEKQIYAETKALKDQELQLAKNYRAEAIRSEQKAYEQNRDNPTEFTAKTLKDAQENIVKAEKAVSDGYDSLIQLQNNHEAAKVQAATDARNKAEEKRKEDQQTAIDKEKAAREKAHAEAKEKRKKELDEMNALEDENDTFRLKQRENLNEQKKEAEEKDRQEFLTRSAETYAAEKVIQDKRAEDDRIELEQKKANQDQLVGSAEQLIQNVAKLAGKNKAIQKAAIIAEGGISVGKAVANTAEAVTKDLAKGAPFSAPLVALDLAVGATSVASIIQGTSKALQAVGGGGSVSAPTLPSASGVNSSPSVGFQASSENQIATSISNSQQALPPIKTYVVGSEVQTQISLDANLVTENSFGG